MSLYSYQYSFNNNGNSHPQSNQQQLPKWDQQFLNDVQPNEHNKTGWISTIRVEYIFSLVTNDLFELLTFKEVVKYGEWKNYD